MKKRNWIFQAAGASLCALAYCFATPAAAAGADYPSRPIKLIVPTAPGGGADFMGRVLAQKLSEVLGVTVVVENKGGAGGTIGSDMVAKADPDGYTLLIGYIGTHGTNPALGKLPYDAVKDFDPISLIAEAQTAILINPKVKANDLAGLIALARAQPGALNYASSGKGSMPHIAGILFEQLTNTSIVPIHYRGSGPALSDTVANRTQLMFGTLVSASGHIKTGALKPLAVTGAKRSPLYPDVPTMEEAGLRGFEVPQWYGVLAPAHTPAPIVARLHDATIAAMRDPVVAKRFSDQGSEVRTSSPEEFRTFIASEIVKWTRVIKDANIQVE